MVSNCMCAPPSATSASRSGESSNLLPLIRDLPFAHIQRPFNKSQNRLLVKGSWHSPQASPPSKASLGLKCDIFSKKSGDGREKIQLM